MAITPLNNFAAVQNFITQVLMQNGDTNKVAFAPHKAFWNTLTFNEFVTGNVPNVSDPNTGERSARHGPRCRSRRRALLAFGASGHCQYFSLFIGKHPLWRETLVTRECRHALSCLPHDMFDSDVDQCRSNARASSV